MRELTVIKIVKIIERSRSVLRSYRGGKIPRIVMILPLVKNFEEFLWLLRPDLWSSEAICSISLKFFSIMEDYQLHRFIIQIFVPRLQEIIFKRKIIPSIFFKTLKKISMKPGLIGPSVIFPLIDNKTCTIKEYLTLYGILKLIKLKKNELNSIFSYILNAPFNPKLCLIIRSLITKNQPLSLEVIDKLSDWFAKNYHTKRDEKVKICFLLFIKYYGKYITNEDKRKLIKNFNQQF
mmetsp:Transcript_19372/g.30275  ORF Transcript_19372/g.30275 Transcript_19372/m.30275 type:complete len:236 (-) Transcript_19372:2281-2988(-)